MYTRLCKLFLLAIILLSSAMPAHSSSLFPLEPPDTSSPRATLKSFLYYTDELYIAATAAEEDFYLERELLQRAVRCFDLSQVPPTLQDDVSIESVLLLREIFDRIPLPDLQDVPDKLDVRKGKLKKWRIPHTEIVIGLVPDGPRMGAFLFTPDTVSQLDDFYNEVRMMPYHEDKGEDYTGFYEQYIYSSGWMIPDGFLKKLPGWMKDGYYGQSMWQWIALGIIFMLGAASLILMWIWHRRRMEKGHERFWKIGRLAFPLYVMALSVFVEYIADDQINVTGDVLSAVSMFLELVFAIYAGLAIIIAGDVVMRGILASTKIKEEALDADVIKLLCRLISFGLVFVLFYNVGSYFGVPVTAIFASAGIAGVAVALAARETLANFFGGVSIFMDRPFRAGDYIVLESGERGEVKAVGMRSTRLLTRDDIMITIPNSVITNAKVVNQSMPHPSFRVRVKIGVAYGSDLDKVEEILMQIAAENEMAIEEPAPRVRLRTFGDSAINFELLCWAARPHDRGRLVHDLSRAIYKRFSSEGVEIPYPKRDVYIHNVED